MRRKVGFVCALFFSISVLCIGVSAEMPSSIDELVAQVDLIAPPITETSVLTDSVSPDTPDGVGETGVTDVSAPVPVVVYDLEEASTYSVTGEGWTGDLSSAVKGYFGGVIANNAGVKYVAFRSSQYLYYLFYGSDLAYSDGVFSGRGQYLMYNSQTQTFSRGTDSLRLSDAGYHIYTNLDGAYPLLVDGEVVVYEKTTVFVCIVILCFVIFSRIFFR